MTLTAPIMLTIVDIICIVIVDPTASLVAAYKAMTTIKTMQMKILTTLPIIVTMKQIAKCTY